MNFLKFALLSSLALVETSLFAANHPIDFISNLPGYYLGLDSEALGTSREQECQVLIREIGGELAFFVKIEGKGVVKMSAVGALQLTDALVRTTKFRQKYDRHMDQSRITAVLYRLEKDEPAANAPGVAVGEPGMIALGWRASDGALTDIHITEGTHGQGRRDLFCTGLKHYR